MRTSVYPERNDLVRKGAAFAVIAAVCLAPVASLAQATAESQPYQPRTTADTAARNAVISVIQQKKGGGYNYNTTVNNFIQSQFNCSVSSTANGNAGQQGATANAPQITGQSGSSTGNTAASQQQATGGYTGTLGALNSNQSNNGAVGSTVSGETNVVNGSAPTELNLASNQGNSGAVSASVLNGTACSGVSK